MSQPDSRKVSLAALALAVLALGASARATRNPAPGPVGQAQPAEPAARAPLIPWAREPIGGPGSGKFLRVADARGRGEDVAALLALDASDRNAVILLIQGNSAEIIEDSKHELSMLVLGGKDRLGLVLGDGPEHTAYIYSRGHMVTTLKNVSEASDRTSGFVRNISRIYERDIPPSPVRP